MPKVSKKLKAARNTTAIDQMISSSITAINRGLCQVDGWIPIFKGYKATLKEFPRDLDGSAKVAAHIYPADWPKTSYVSIELRKLHSYWQLEDAVIVAPHMNTSGLPLAYIRLELAIVKGFVRIELKDVGMPGPEQPVLKILQKSVEARIR